MCRRSLFHVLEHRLDLPGRVDDDTAAGQGDAAHLGKSGPSVLHEHQSHLTQDDVVGVVGERE
jgi:hypothetical protein